MSLAILPKRPDGRAISDLPVYFAVGLEAGAVIALQIAIMRIFSIGSWAHFGSLVVSLAMLGFGLMSTIMCIAKDWFARHWRLVCGAALLSFGPLAVGANLLAQQVPFNAIFLVSDPNQKWRLLANFLLYFTPFLAGAAFLGSVFLQARTRFNRVYFADLLGSGLCGLVVLLAMYVFTPQDLILAPLVLWLMAAAAWFFAVEGRRALLALIAVGIATFGAHLWLAPALGLSKLAVSDYKGVAYARKFPDSQRVYAKNSPFGYLEIYASSYLHFAPGLSDNAAFNLKTFPDNAYEGMYIDSDGPEGIIRALPAEETDYYFYLPMIYPYLVKPQADTFVVQFGGGLSTAVALTKSKHVTVAESNPAVLDAFLHDDALRRFTGDILHDGRVRVVGYEGRLYLAHTAERYDVIDLSLADSTGLSNPGGFAIVEKFAYTREAMQAYMRALKPDGVLAVTLWNKEEPPKSVLKLYATMVEAARANGDLNVAQDFFAASCYLSTATVLYKKNGFSEAEIALLLKHTKAMSFDAIYYPGLPYDETQTGRILGDFHDQIFFDASKPPGDDLVAPDGGAAADAGPPETDSVVPAVTMGELAWHSLIDGTFGDIAKRYVFDARPLTNDRPYFAAYIKPLDLPRILDRLELVQDEWGYLLLWATLGVATLCASTLIVLPVIFGWRTVFSATPGKLRTILYFACLGAGYIMVEVGLIAEFVQALSNATVSAAILITGMLVASGLGSLVSERFLARAPVTLPKVLLGIGALLIAYGLFVHAPLDWIGTFPYGLRLFFCFLLIFPPAFLMGFPMPTAMGSLARLEKDHMFLWAWGINGCFSVIGAALVPLVATSFGLSTVLYLSGAAYLIAIPAFFGVILPIAGRSAWHARGV
jgi:SAM-dependent methyltransferase